MRILFAFVFIAACASEHHGDADGPPAAPTSLAVSNVSGGAHLVWEDNSENEAHFMIMRKSGTGAYAEVDMVTFDITQYHDSSVAAGMTYTYKVMAMNEKGASDSNEVTFAP